MSREEEYTKVIDSALKANQELVKEYDWNFGENDIFERKESNIMIWEDENNYYVYLRKNNFNDGYDYVYGDGYKIAKTNDSWDSSPDDRAKIKEFLDDNVSPIYEENNIELVSDDKDMR
ncbi:hypothetical protein RV18_GL002347 [Enterococcus termitis]|nr:hypothetical protein RV18_GL002347 [Enterococcus termitis]